MQQLILISMRHIIRVDSDGQIENMLVSRVEFLFSTKRFPLEERC